MEQRGMEQLIVGRLESVSKITKQEVYCGIPTIRTVNLDYELTKPTGYIYRLVRLLPNNGQ